MTNLLGRDVPNSDDLVFSTRGKISAIGAETDAPDVQVPVCVGVVVLKVGDLRAGVDVVDLSRSVTTGRNESSIVTKSHTAHDTLVRQVVNEVDIQSATHLGIEHGMPVIADSFKVGR
jgi:hypothetical protein